jgi:hypothetical protein
MNQVATETCLNCGSELQSEFCHACGQKAAATHLGAKDQCVPCGHIRLEFLDVVLTSSGSHGSPQQGFKRGELRSQLELQFLAAIRVELQGACHIFEIAAFIERHRAI